jgi:serine/threonine-protein kinase
MVTIAAELLPGTLVDRRYRIQRVLGRGGFGRTYLVVDKWRFGELCVLKEFAPSNRGDAVVTQKLRELFQREATILHKLNHPQIPKFFAVFEENSRLFIVQEYINGKTYWNLLREKHQNSTTFTETEILQWLKDLLRVLSYLHKQNIVHRDISPDNVMLARGKKLPILIDFGAVKQAATQLNQVNSPADDLIQASVSVGKSGYAPYEQLRLGQCSPRSDLYALAVTAVVLMTAKPPSQLIDPGSLEWKWQAIVQLDPILVKILSKMMAEKPQERYASADAVLKDLQRVRPSATAEPISHSPEWVKEEATRLQLKRLNALFPAKQVPPTRLQPAEVKAIVHRPVSKPPAPPLKVPQPKIIVGNPGKLTLTWNKLLIGGCLALLPLVGMVIGVQSSYIAAVCESLDNCAIDQQVALSYQEAVRQATMAQTLSEMAKNLPDLRLARNKLSAAVAQLSGLVDTTDDRPLTTQVNQKLVAYRSSLDDLETRLEKESKANELLGRAKAEAEQASQLTTIATKTQNYTAARQQWAKALATLQAVGTSTFAQNQVMARSQEYTARLETLDSQIAALNPQSAPQPQIIAVNPFRVLVGEPLTEPSVASAPPAQASPSAPPQRVVYVPVAAPTATAPTATALTATAPRPGTPSRPIAASTLRPALATAAISVPRPPVSRPTIARSTQTVAIASPQPRPIAQPQPAIHPAATRPTAPRPAATRLIQRMPTEPPAPDPRPSQTIAAPSSASKTLAQQTLNDVSIQLAEARVSPDGTVAANLVVENHSDRTFGFVPLFAEVEDADGNIVRSRVHFTNTEDGMAEPGEVLHGQIHMFNRQWKSSGSQNLALVIQEGTSGSRNFRLTF